MVAVPVVAGADHEPRLRRIGGRMEEVGVDPQGHVMQPLRWNAPVALEPGQNAAARSPDEGSPRQRQPCDTRGIGTELGVGQPHDARHYRGSPECPLPDDCRDAGVFIPA